MLLKLCLAEFVAHCQSVKSRPDGVRLRDTVVVQ